jgi:NADH-quinone oxidoreductase subunit G
LQKFAREVLGTANIDHHRTGDLPTLFDALTGRTDALASMADLYNTKAALVIGADLAQQQPLVAFQLRSNARHHAARVYTITEGPVRERKYAAASIIAPPEQQLAQLESLREKLAAEPELVIMFGDTVKGDAVRQLVAFGDSLGIPVKYVCLVDFSNSRGASDMGLLPHLGPGYKPAAAQGYNRVQMLTSAHMDALWIVGAETQGWSSPGAFVVVQDMFLSKTAQSADVVFPSASAYEKDGTVTNVTGEVQKLKRALKTMGTRPDLEIFGLIAKEMGITSMPAAKPDAIFEQIRKSTGGYNVPLPIIMTGGAAQAMPLNGRVPASSVPDLIQSARDTLFTSGYIGRYSKNLNSVVEKQKVKLYESGVSAP